MQTCANKNNNVQYEINYSNSLDYKLGYIVVQNRMKTIVKHVKIRHNGDTEPNELHSFLPSMLVEFDLVLVR